MAGIEMLSEVAMLEDLPEEGLGRGQVGAVVEKWAPGLLRSRTAVSRSFRGYTTEWIEAVTTVPPQTAIAG
jgi:hypothetical protein